MQKSDMNSAQTSEQAAPADLQLEAETTAAGEQSASLPKEINGPKGPEPTRFGDWERKGRCVDF